MRRTPRGLAIVRSYQLLQPMRIVRPSGGQSFQLTVPSSVDILVNGRSARRLRLEPGNYNVRDFPFAQGGNDIRVLVDQGAGPREVLHYSVFYDTAQLARGLDEFAFYAGVKSDLGPSGPEYSNDWLFSGFYRRGLTDSLTGGIHFQSDADTTMGGFEGLWSSQIGLFGGDLSVSRADGFGKGWAGSVTYERVFAGAGTFDLRFETRSRDFAPLGSLPPSQPLCVGSQRRALAHLQRPLLCRCRPVLQQGARKPSQPVLLSRQCRLPAHPAARAGGQWNLRGFARL